MGMVVEIMEMGMGKINSQAEVDSWPPNEGEKH